MPDAAARARLGVEETTARLQTLPDSTLRLLAAASIGLATGLQLAGAPRLFIFAAIAVVSGSDASLIGRCALPSRPMATIKSVRPASAANTASLR